LGVERSGGKGEDAFVGMLFRQANGGIESIRLFEDCTFSRSPAEQEALKNWAYTLVQPNF
jgi:hypothetical protein